MTILNQKVNELVIENAKTHSIIRERNSIIRKEVRTLLSKASPYINKPAGSPQLEIENYGFTLNREKVAYGQISDLSNGKPVITATIVHHGEENKEKKEREENEEEEEEEEDSIDYCASDLSQNGEEAIHFPDLSYNSVFDFSSETKSMSNLSVVTVMIGEEGEGEEKKNRELFQREGPTEIISTIGGFKSVNNRYTHHPDSGNLGFLPNPDPEPPDVYCPTAKVSFPMKSSTTLSSMMRGVGIQTVSSILVPSR